MSLRNQLDALTAKLRAMVHAERLAVVDLAAAQLSYSGLAERALKVGLVYRLSTELQAMYESIMTKPPGYNGDQSWELPLAATYVVQPDGKISWSRVDEDWRHRPEPEELLHVVTDSVEKNAAG